MTLHSGRGANEGEVCVIKDESLPQHDYTASSIMETNIGGIFLVFLGLFFTGFGQTVYFALSVSYLDDNVSRKNSPFMLAVSMLVRVLGPILGIGLASACLKYYVNPNNPPDYGEEDTRWVGAWWLGMPILGLMTMVVASLIMMFPKRLPIRDSTYTTDAASQVSKRIKMARNSGRRGSVVLEATQSYESARKTIERVLKNRIFMCNLIGAWANMFFFSGLATFMAKFYQVYGTCTYQSACNIVLFNTL